ncbi:MAG: hypothetical protein QG638_113, partial [Pseudomonadota bacterium]|nr:hypothetical protein [Pseudomonadota bacterium]
MKHGPDLPALIDLVSSGNRAEKRKPPKLDVTTVELG